MNALERAGLPSFVCELRAGAIESQTGKSFSFQFLRTNNAGKQLYDEADPRTRVSILVMSTANFRRH